MATQGVDFQISGTMTANGTTAQYGTIITATASKLSRVSITSIIAHLRQDTTGTRTQYYGLTITPNGGTPRVILGGSVTQVNSTDHVMTVSSGGSDPYNLFTRTVGTAGIQQIGIRTTGGFFNAGAVTPVPRIPADIGTLNDDLALSTYYVDYTDGLFGPIFLSNQATLRFFMANSAGTAAQIFYKATGVVYTDTLQT